MKKLLIFLLLIMPIFFILISPALAYDPPKPIQESGALDNLSKEPNAGKIINNIVLYLTYILGGLFVLMMLVGSIAYAVYPDAEKKQRGMVVIRAAIVAGVMALLSLALWAVLRAVLA